MRGAEADAELDSVTACAVDAGPSAPEVVAPTRLEAAGEEVCSGGCAEEAREGIEEGGVRAVAVAAAVVVEEFVVLVVVVVVGAATGARVVARAALGAVAAAAAAGARAGADDLTEGAIESALEEVVEVVLAAVKGSSGSSAYGSLCTLLSPFAVLASATGEVLLLLVLRRLRLFRSLDCAALRAAESALASDAGETETAGLVEAGLLAALGRREGRLSCRASSISLLRFLRTELMAAAAVALTLICESACGTVATCNRRSEAIGLGAEAGSGCAKI